MSQDTAWHSFSWAVSWNVKEGIAIVAKATASRKENAIIRYLKDTRAELRKVTWPSREEALNLTLIVLAVTVAMAVGLGLVDYLFSLLFGLVFG
jgi:preprotein translocase subunit SecE